MWWADLPEQLTSLVLKEVTLTENSILSIYIFSLHQRSWKNIAFSYDIRLVYETRVYKNNNNFACLIIEMCSWTTEEKIRYDSIKKNCSIKLIFSRLNYYYPCRIYDVA